MFWTCNDCAPDICDYSASKWVPTRDIFFGYQCHNEFSTDSLHISEIIDFDFIAKLYRPLTSVVY